MTRTETFEWEKDAKCIDITSSHDGHGNVTQYKIFEKDGKLWKIEYCNGGLAEWYEAGKGILREQFGPREVNKKVVTKSFNRYTEIERSEGGDISGGSWRVDCDAS